jgi:hypothetical protein
LFESGILLIIDLNKKKGKTGGGWILFVNFVIKLHTWFCLSYFLKTSIIFYCIYQYVMSINSLFNLKEDLHSTNLISNPNCICGYQSENADHYLLFCNHYIVYRNKMLSSFWKYIWRNFDLKWAKIGICRILRSNIFHSLIVEGKKDCWRSASLFACWLIFWLLRKS